jgi:hypothetical protein
MPGKEALDFIRSAELGCSEAGAIDQLRAAIVNCAVGARLTHMQRPPVGSSPNQAPFESVPQPAAWQRAQMRPDGSVRFDRNGPWRGFEVIRENVRRIWRPEPPNDRQPKVMAHPTARVQARPIKNGILEAISALWPDGIPAGLKAKERNNKILEHLCAQGHSVPEGSGLARAVQRAMKPRD